MASPDSLRRDLEYVWAADTAIDPEAWTPARPSTGHCAVTAMLVAEYTDATTILRVVMPDGQPTAKCRTCPAYREESCQQTARIFVAAGYPRTGEDIGRAALALSRNEPH